MCNVFYSYGIMAQLGIRFRHNFIWVFYFNCDITNVNRSFALAKLVEKWKNACRKQRSEPFHSDSMQLKICFYFISKEMSK